MNHKIFTLFVLLSTAIIISSCLNSNDDSSTVTYNDTAITSFALGTVKQLRDTVTKSGADSTYYKAVSGSSYKFTINQATGQILNTDSLPYGTKVSAVLATITAKKSGIIGIKSLTNNSFSSYTSSDSIDFSQPRTIRVYANSSRTYREYTVTVNVHKQKGDTFTWTERNDYAAFASLTGTKAVALGDKVYIFGTNGTNTKGYATGISDGNSWTALSQSFSSDAYQSVVSNGSVIYTLSNGKVLRSTDGASWTTATPNKTLKQIVLATNTQLYAILSDGSLAASSDNGATWTAESLNSGSSSTLLPASSITGTTLSTNVGDDVSRLLLAGIPSGKTSNSIWTRLVSKQSTYAWSLINPSSNTYALPTYKNLTVLTYDSNAIALGQNSNGTLAPILLTTDGGITWKKNKSYTVPSTTATASNFATTVDKNYNLWVISGKKVWKGVLTKLTWN